MKNLVYLLNFMKEKKYYYVFAIICMGMSILVTLISPIIIQLTVDSVLGNQPISQASISYVIDCIGGLQFLKNNLWVTPVMFFIFILLRGMFSYFMGKYSAIASESTVEIIKNSLYKRTLI